jgi:hypothetical protein
LADQGVVGEAAKIKAEEAQAKARKAAVRYLGTVDCGRFPDAEGALVKALRTDTNECVRYEAALALGNGCCCTNTTMEALAITAACSNRDGNPREYSDRVRAAAVAALQNCLSCFVDPNPPKQEKEIEGPATEGATTTTTKNEKRDDKANADAKDEKVAKKAERPVGAAYYAKIKEVPRHLIVEEARRVVDNFNEVASAQVILTRQNSLVTIINSSFDDRAVMDQGGASTMRAEMAATRPNTLWDVLTKQSTVVDTGLPVRNDVVVKNTVEPPTMAMPHEPMPMTVMKNDGMPPIVPQPMPRTEAPAMNVVKSEPVPTLAIPKVDERPLPSVTAPKSEIPKVIVPGERITRPGSYGEQTVIRPKTPAELASQPRTINADNFTPAPTPTVIASEPTKPIVVMEPSKSMIAVETPKPVVVPEAPKKVIVPEPPKLEVAVEPIKKPVAQETPKPIIVPPTNKVESMKPVEAAKPTVTPLAQRAITVLTEPHPAAVRESIADTLAASDVNSSPELVTALVKQAGSTDAESARKAAIRALVRCQVNRPDVLSALDKLTEDPSPAIRMEAAIATARLRVLENK